MHHPTNGIYESRTSGKAVPAEPPYVIGDIEGNHVVINLRNDAETSAWIFNDSPDESDIERFKKWLFRHRDDYVRLYHGTSSSIPVKEEGLKRTSAKTKKSMQSETGYVYLSVYPDSARTFGEIAYPYDEVTVYAVDIKIRQMKADKDQLRNRRMWDPSLRGVGDSLAESLVYGHGARVGRDILPYEIKRTDF